ncbi:MAG: hypothetical protein LAT76_10300 [Schleiferiaceae bacterium]|nr:hypothetical protein [Schleiferiaceae bacterium]
MQGQHVNQIFQVDEFGFRNYKPLADVDPSTLSLTITKFNEVNQKYELWKYFLEKADLSKSDSILLHSSEVTGRIDAYN